MKNMKELFDVRQAVLNGTGVITPTDTETTQEKTTFPTDLLPEWLQETIRDHAESYGTPEELWAVAFLTAIATASGGNVKYPSRFISAPLWHFLSFPHIYLPKIIIVP